MALPNLTSSTRRYLTWGIAALLAGGAMPVFGQGTPAPVYVQLSAGAYHAAALDSAGTVWVWGRNTTGQLGDGTAIDRPRPVAVVTPLGASQGTRWSAVVAGTFHTAALRSDGSLWTWGDNTNGQLGDGTRVPHAQPLRVPTPPTANPNTRWTQVAVGANHTVALRSDGTLWTWGANYWGQLGDNSGMVQPLPVQIVAPTSSLGAYWTRAVTTDDHTVALTSDGRLWGWGRDQRAQLGLGTPTTVHPFPTIAFQAPLPVGQSWTDLATGEAFTLALRSDGSLWACGANDSDQLGGAVTPTAFAATPVRVPTPVGVTPGSSWVHISARGAHALGWRTDGSLWCWGENYDGQLGLNSTTNPAEPVREYTHQNWSLAAAGSTYAIALAGGQLAATGANDYGQSGNGPGNGSLVFRSLLIPLAGHSPALAPVYALWPNPAQDRVCLSGIPRSARVQLCDLTGHLLQTPSTGTDWLLVQGLASGVYLVRIQEPNKPSQTIRLTIE